jgi:hypothetical protein
MVRLAMRSFWISFKSLLSVKRPKAVKAFNLSRIDVLNTLLRKTLLTMKESNIYSVSRQVKKRLI